VEGRLAHQAPITPPAPPGGGHGEFGSGETGEFTLFRLHPPGEGPSFFFFTRPRTQAARWPRGAPRHAQARARPGLLMAAPRPPLLRFRDPRLRSHLEHFALVPEPQRREHPF